MTRAQASALAAAVALSIIAAVTTYAFVRPGDYQSTAVLALAPRRIPLVSRRLHVRLHVRP